MKTIKLLSTVMAVAIVAIATAVEEPRMNVVPLTTDSAIAFIQNGKTTLFDSSVNAQNGDLVHSVQLVEPMHNDAGNAAGLRFVETRETNLEIEYWMTCSAFWDVRREILEIENWMINEDIWKLENPLIIETETEQGLSIENWMTNEQFWKM